jgi:hypothetical protein
LATNSSQVVRLQAVISWTPVTTFVSVSVGGFQAEEL